MKNFLGDIFYMSPELDVQSAAEHIRGNISFKGANVWILACAIVTASLGLNVNSTAVIIGAMLISPLMGPIIGIGLATSTVDLQLMKTSLVNLGVMVVISIIFSSLFFVISPLDMSHPSELLARTNPTIYDVMIALVGGAAGALETSRKQKGTVISGVAIATALMPPLCTVGYGLSNLNLRITAGAFYLFFINCVFVALATFLVFKALNIPKVKHLDASVQKRASTWATIFIIVLIVPSVLSAVQVVRENNFNTKAEKYVNSIKKNLDNCVIYDYSTNTSVKPYRITLYMAGTKLSDTDKEVLFREAEQEYNIGRHQIQFEMALTYTNAGDFEKQVYSDLNTSLKQLQDELAAYKAQVLPYSQINAEVKALFPQFTSMSLARGQEKIFAIVSSGEELEAEYLENLKKWLEIRLDSENVEIIQTVR